MKRVSMQKSFVISLALVTGLEFGLTSTGTAIAQPAVAAASTEAAASVSASAEVPAPVADDDSIPFDRGMAMLPALRGPIGLFGMSTANAGAPGVFRIGLHGEYSSASSFIVQGDENRRFQGAFAFGLTPIRYLEIFGAIQAAANQNQRDSRREAGRRDPEIIRSFGDILLGSKFARPVANGLSLGGQVDLRLMSATAGVTFEPSATSVGFGGVATMDLREVSQAPLRFHANLGYYLDNSANVQDLAKETKQTKAVSSFAYGISNNRLRTAIGVDAPLEKLNGSDVSLQPFAEYHFEFITADADPKFREFVAPMCSTSANPPPGKERCNEIQYQHWLTFGLRARVPGNLVLDAGIDLGLRSLGHAYGPALPPFNVIFGLSYPLDLTNLGKPKIVTRTVEKIVERDPAPKDGFVSGKVTSAKGGLPVVGAIVSVIGMPTSRVATDPDGKFVTKGLPAGEATLEIAAASFQPLTVKANVLIGQSVDLGPAALVAKDTKSRVQGRLLDEGGKGIAGATIKFSGPENTDARSDIAGGFSVDLIPGSYTARAEGPSFDAKDQSFAVSEGIASNLDISVGKAKAAGPSSVKVQGKRLTFSRPVGFVAKGGNPSAELTAAAQRVLDDLAEALNSHPEIKKVHIETHVDSGAAKADAITSDQAKKISSYLAAHGVSGDRVDAIGMGAKRPLVPNIGAAAKMRNRRVEIRAVDGGRALPAKL